MKKLLFMIMIMLITTNVYAVDGKISFAYLDDSNLKSIDNTIVTYIGTVNVGHTFKYARPYIVLETFMDDFENNSFSPVEIDYDIGINIPIVKGLYIDLSHKCKHGIDTVVEHESYNKIEIGYTF